MMKRKEVLLVETISMPHQSLPDLKTETRDFNAIKLHVTLFGVCEYIATSWSEVSYDYFSSTVIWKSGFPVSGRFDFVEFDVDCDREVKFHTSFEQS